MEPPESDDFPEDSVNRTTHTPQRHISFSSEYQREEDTNVTKAQQKALEAVEAYHSQIAKKLLGQSLEDSSTQVCKAVQELIAVHNRDMDRASERNTQLCSQLKQCMGTVEELTRQLYEMKRNPLPPHIPARARDDIEKGSWVSAITSSGEPCKSGGMDSAPSQEGCAQPSGDSTEAEGTARTSRGIEERQAVSDADILEVLEYNPASEAFSQEKIEERVTDYGMLSPKSEQFLAGLLAKHAKAQAILQILRDDREHWKRSTMELQSALQGALEESIECRNELSLLRLATVPLEQYKLAVEARDVATYELEAMKLKTEKLEEDLERMRSPQSAENDAYQDVIAAAVATCQEVQNAMAHLIEEENLADENKEERLHAPHEGASDPALCELNKQTQLTSEHHAMQERLEEAERRLEQITAENHRLESTFEDLQNVNNSLRLDAQALVYRNAVLSQQVTSLLVKVERLRRELKHGERTLEQGAENSNLYMNPRRSGNFQQKDAAKAAAIASEVLRQRLLEECPSDFAALPGVSSKSSGNMMEISTSSFSSCDEKVDASNNVRTSAASFSHFSCLPGTTRSRGPCVIVDNTVPSTEETPAAATPSLLLASLDVSFLPLAEGDVKKSRLAFDKLQVERGLRRTLSTFSLSPPGASDVPRQHVTLRNFGGGTTYMGNPSAAKLPTCDQLSGVSHGRPSSHLLLDPHRGYFTRQGSNAESVSALPPRWRPKLPVNEEIQNPDSTSSTIVTLPKGASATCDQGGLLSTLALLDADEELDRYSLNRVSELVVRNQELLNQVYIVTQRAEVMEAQLKRLRADAVSQSVGQKAVIRPDKRWIQPSRTHPLASGTTESLRGARNSAALSGTDEPQQSTARVTGEYVSNLARKRVRYDKNAALPHIQSSTTTIVSEESTDAHGKSSSSSQSGDIGAELLVDTPSETLSVTREETEETRESVNSAAHDTTDVHSLSSGMQDAVKSLIETALYDQHARVARLDGGLAASLIRVLQAKDAAEAAQNDANAPSETKEDEYGGLAENAVFQPLVEVCASQAGMLAQQATELVKARQEAQATFHGGLWETSQQLLQHAVRELRELLSEIVKGRQKLYTVSPSSSASDTRKRSRSADIDEATTSSTGLPLLTCLDEVALLERVGHLLQVAIEKEDTTLRVYQASQRRQRHFIAQKEKRIRQMATKVKNMLRQQQLNTSLVQGNPLALSPSMPVIGSTIQLPKTLMAGTGVGSGTPIVATSFPFAKAISPKGLPASIAGENETSYDLENVEKQVRDALVRKKGEGLHGLSHLVEEDEDGDDCSDGDEGSDIDDMTCGQLREQLAQAQAKLARLTEELDTERAGHVELSARMWQLEVEREDALAERKNMESRIESMWTREQYEGMVAELDALRAAVEDRDAQLSYAYQEKEKLRVELEHYQERYSAFIEANQATVRERDLQLANQERQNAQLVQECTQHESRIVNLVKEAEAHVQVLADIEKHNAELELQIGKARHTLLSDDSTQAILLSLYPGNALVEAHTQLVQTMQKKCKELEARVQDLFSQLGQTKTELLRKDTELRQAVQKCQETENKLEESLYFIARRGLEIPYEKEAEREDKSAPDDESTNKSSEEEEDATPWITFKKRIQELQVCVKAQKCEIERLQKSEAAWKVREETLRGQLDAMSRDPMSEIVRRYGLKTVKNFEAIVEEMQGRVVELQTQVDVQAAKVAELETTLRQVEENRKTAELCVEELQNRIEKITAERDCIHLERQELSSSVEAQKMKLEAQDATLSQLQNELSEIKDHNHSTEQELRECVIARDKLYGDNCSLVDKVDELVQALAQAESEKRAANAAAAQNARAARAVGQGHLNYHPRIGGVHALEMHLQDSLEADPNSFEN